MVMEVLDFIADIVVVLVVRIVHLAILFAVL